MDALCYILHFINVLVPELMCMLDMYSLWKVQLCLCKTAQECVKSSALATFYRMGGEEGDD